METQLVHFNTAKRELALATSIDEVKDIRDKAELLRMYTKQCGETLEMQNYCAEIKIRAERRAGELLGEMEKHPGAATLSHDVTALPPKLEDIGISRMQSSRWQLEATVPEDKFEEYVSTTKAKREELTSKAILNLAKRQDMDVHYSSESPEWCTPQNILEKVYIVLGTIDLDPCSNPEVPPNVGALNHFTIEDNGLNQPWIGKVYMNPPYGKEIHDWVLKLTSEHEQNNVPEAIALVPARVDTEWFSLFRDTLICFIKGRLKFSGYENSAPFPSAVIYLGENHSSFWESFQDIGDIWRRWNPSQQKI